MGLLLPARESRPNEGIVDGNVGGVIHALLAVGEGELLILYEREVGCIVLVSPLLMMENDPQKKSPSQRENEEDEAIKNDR